MRLLEICLLITIMCDAKGLCKVKHESIDDPSLEKTSMIDLNCHNHDINHNILEETEQCQRNNESNSQSNDINVSGSTEDSTANSSSETSSEELRKITTTTSTTTSKPTRRSNQARRSTQGIEGNDGPLTHHQYTVSIQRKGSHYATGALIGKRWVITTAAEFYNVHEHLKLFRMRFGSADCKRRGITMPMKDVHLHPFFMPGRPDFDISLIQTASEVPLGPTVKPVALSSVTGKILQAKFMVTYWPRIVIKDTILPPTAKERLKYKHMRVSTQKLVSKKDCTDLLMGLDMILATSTYCLKPIVEYHSVCMPDVGAPVVGEDGLWGVTSGWAPPHCAARAPTLFTRVAAADVSVWLAKMMNSTLGLTLTQ